MTDKLREAAQKALEVLEQLQGGCTDSDDGTVEVITVWCPEVIDTLRAALAQQPEVRQWTGLTDIGVYFAITAAGKPPNPMSEEFFTWCEKFADAIEANLKERNA